MEKFEKGTDAKLDQVLNLVKGGEGSDGHIANIIHSLCYHLDNNVSSSSYIEDKLLPLKTVLNGGIHRKCMGKFIMDKIVNALAKESSVGPKSVNEVAKIIRVVLYSKAVGGKRDKRTVDDGGLDYLSREMKARMT